MDKSVYIKSIHIYPVKSLGSINLDESRIARRGLKGDRRWMILNAENSMITQRDYPELSLCRMAIVGRSIEIEARNRDGSLLGTTTLPSNLKSGHKVYTQVWKDDVGVTLYDGPANDFLSEFLGAPIRFAYQMDNQIRETDPEYSRSGDIVSLADGYPILLTTQKSLDDLNSRLESAVSMGRFRPNIVVDGDLDPYEEDYWTFLENDSNSWRVVKACGRCSMTTITNEGEFSKEPLRTLSSYRKVGSKVMFGMNVISDHSGEIKVGDKLNVVRSIVGSDHG